MAIIDVSKLVPLAEIDKIKDRIASISEERHAVEKEIKEIEESLTEDQNEMSNLLREKGIHTRVIKDGESTIESIEKSLDSYADEIAKIEKSIDTEYKNKAETEDKIKQSKEALEPAEQELEKKLKEITSLKEDNREIPKELIEQYNAAEAEVSLIRGNINIYQGFIDKSEQVIDDLKKSQKIIERDKAQAQDKKSLTEVSIAEASDSLSDVEENIRDVEDVIKTKEAQLKKANDTLRKVSEDLEANQKELEEKEESRSGWNVSFEATALENYVEDLGEMSQEAKDQLNAKQIFNKEIADTLGIRGSEQDKKYEEVIKAVQVDDKLSKTEWKLNAETAKLMADIQNYTMASLVEKITSAAMKGLVQIKLETTLTKGVINALFAAGYDVHFESDNNKYITVINWAHPGMTNPAGPN